MRVERQSPQAANPGAMNVSVGDVQSMPQTGDTSADLYFDHFAARCVQDAINCGLAATWERRRAAFLAARPTREDFPGRLTTREDLRARWLELTAIADACAARASVSLRHEEIDPDVWEAIAC
jgi:hypothetical protein